MRKQMRISPLIVCTILGFLAVLFPWIAVADHALTDSAISKKIEKELLFDAGVPAYKITVRTEDGIVTLLGSVEDIRAKERSARIAETVRGVRSVVNRIEVELSSPVTDAKLIRSIHDALLRDPATESFEVSARADDGAVVLSGSVDSHRERELCATVAKGVRGVKQVRNEISVDYKKERSDREMMHEIRQTLRWSVLVDDTLIEVMVSDGQAVLSGSVGSAAEKREARLAAWILGIDEVDDSQLKVVDGMRDEKRRHRKYVAKSPEDVRAAIIDALTHDPRVSSLKVDVEVAGSTVALRGAVDNLRAKRAAEQVARNTVGVTLVSNHLKVEARTPVADETVAANVRSALKDDSLIVRDEILVAVEQGTVHLNGEVASYFEKSLAEDVASRVQGVVGIENHLAVSRDTPFTFSPYIDDAFHDESWYDYRPVHTEKSDAELKKEVVNQLFWSPYVDVQGIEVLVEDQRVILNGEADSLNERQQAELNAWKAGAARVENNLTLKLSGE